MVDSSTIAVLEDCESKREATDGTCASVEATPNDVDLNFGDVFSLRKPRDICAGTSSGLKSCSKGVLIGVAGLFGYPYILAKEKGAKGFFGGLALGSLSCLASSLGGTVVGATQILRGVLNTPVAIWNAAKKKRWNKDKRIWEVDYYNLKEEAEALRGTEQANIPSKDRASSSTSRPQKVVDTSLYDALGVEVDCTAGDVRKAYYKRSLKCHPDKNDSPEAAKEFHLISQAYQVLSDEERRKVYNTQGKDAATQEMPELDPSIFFNSLFGSFLFEPYVGVLKVSTFLDGVQKKDGRQNVKQTQALREVELAVLLAERLDEGIEIGPEAFAEKMEAEARRLQTATNGGELLQAIGYVYKTKAQLFGANFAMKGVWNVRKKGHTTKMKTKALKSITQSVLSLKKTQSEMVKKEKEKVNEATEKVVRRGCLVRVVGLLSNTDLNESVGYVQSMQSDGRAVVLFSPEELPKAVKTENLVVLTDVEKEKELGEGVLESLPLFMDTLWDVSVIDIQSTLHNVCTKVLKDMSVEQERRDQRLAALLVVGNIFSAASKCKMSKEKKKEEFEFAMQMMAAGATGEDVEYARQQMAESPQLVAEASGSQKDQLNAKKTEAKAQHVG